MKNEEDKAVHTFNQKILVHNSAIGWSHTTLDTKYEVTFRLTV